MCRDGVGVDPAVTALLCGASFVVSGVSRVVARVCSDLCGKRGDSVPFPWVRRCAAERSGRARAVRPGPPLFATRSLGALKFCILQCVARPVLGPSASMLANRALVSVRVASSLVPWSSHGCRAVTG